MTGRWARTPRHTVTHFAPDLRTVKGRYGYRHEGRTLCGRTVNERLWVSVNPDPVDCLRCLGSLRRQEAQEGA